MEKNIILEKEKGIATIIMNRTKVLNTLHPDLITEFLTALKDVKEDDEIKVIVVTGAGRAFCAGGDLPYIESIDNPIDGKKYIKMAGSIVMGITKMEKPVIAMVNGVAAGAGFNIALACDIIYCSKSARFAQSFSKVGLVPDCGGSYLLPRAVGSHKAKELMFTGELINSETAYELGFLNKVVDDDKLKEETYKFAEKLVKAAPIPLAFIKTSVNQSERLTLEDALEVESDKQSFCLQTQDNKEGVRAFKEKRAPIFSGK
ncbi:enoyl-CoA hydratase/isomerase family protein [Maledivibacter halophilus]|uniref:short-chain-enoyl-CoA hydratase n=1 Tax=Maledivibacter halophilus TaxID=36842 RepID=A0A1T5JEA0_9FIRM|nr:enoyl-CoA hydratase [Maledivibacter halophilus]SKC49602.1 2-(1,2-epoxy-1,2-dihydrophenyl)acetyl-CoA isomerase [Maledivibacter halophilus]